MVTSVISLVSLSLLTSGVMVVESFMIRNYHNILIPNPSRQVAAFVSSSTGRFQNEQINSTTIFTGLADTRVNDAGKDELDFIETIVLRQVYPAMMQHLQLYGNPNIPLGSTNGKKCKTIRRLAFENKLTSKEMDWLQSINFRFNSFEEVYEEADFQDCLERLVDYEATHKTNYQIPKKYNPDPELGAWVTMIRRIGKDSIEPERRHQLDEINFTWISTRKCGSSFMKQYRSIKERLSKCMMDDKTITDEPAYQDIIQDNDVSKWIRAQKLAYENGNLSESRCEYMDDLGVDWHTF